MASFEEWFARFTEATGESVEQIVLGWRYGWGDYKKDEWPYDWPWGEVRPVSDLPVEMLRQEFHDGFGANETPNLCGWSESWVVFSYNYDGAEGLRWVPRNPISHEPIRPGGG